MYEEIKQEFQKIVKQNNLQKESATCKILAKGFSGKTPETNSKNQEFVEENFELPSKEYALVEGKEVLVRCKVGDSYGDSFTDKPKAFEGKINQVFDMASGDRSDKAIFFSTLNATLSYLDLIDGGTIHCQEGDPEKCGNELAEHILDKYGEAKVAHIGYQPGHLEACSKHFDSQVTDMNTKNIGEEKFGVKVIDASENERVIKEADVACITGSTITNGTLPELLEWCETYETEPIVYGVTCRGAAEILGLETFCPYGRDNF